MTLYLGLIWVDGKQKLFLSSWSFHWEKRNLQVINLSHELVEAKELYKVLNGGLQTQDSIEFFPIIGLRRRMSRSILNMFVLMKMKKPSWSSTSDKNSFYPSLKTPEIIWLHHSDGNQPIRATIQVIVRKYRWPGMYRQVDVELQKCDFCIR